MLLRQSVRFLFKGSLLNLMLHNPARNFVKFGRHRIHFRADDGARFVHEVDRLIGQETVRNITV